MANKKNKTQPSYSIFGLNGCSELLQSGQFQINHIYLQEGSQADKNRRLFDPRHQYANNITGLSKHTFKNRFHKGRTQGIVVEFFGHGVKKDLPNFSQVDSACILVLDQIEDPQNFGQIIRTSECAGIDGLLFPKHHSAPISDTVLQVSQGAFVNLPLYEATNLKHEFQQLKEDGFWIVGLENSIDAEEWHKIDYKGKVAIVVGSEGKGIREKVLESCDFKATIPMQGKTDSLNVSAAVSALLFERLRQISL